MKIKQIPQCVVDAVRERGFSDDQIERMGAQRLFSEYCVWHGLINWGDHLYLLADELHHAEDAKESGKVFDLFL